jgi:hypothetical protein
MTKKRKIIASALACYAALWVASWFLGPKVLSRQLMADAAPRWREWNSKRLKKVMVDGREVAVPSLPVYDSGPIVRVENVLSPLPFVFRADCTKAIHGLDGVQWVGWYFVTPWHAYEVASEVTLVASSSEPIQCITDNSGAAPLRV